MKAEAGVRVYTVKMVISQVYYTAAYSGCFLGNVTIMLHGNTQNMLLCINYACITGVSMYVNAGHYFDDA